MRSEVLKPQCSRWGRRHAGPSRWMLPLAALWAALAAAAASAQRSAEAWPPAPRYEAAIEAIRAVVPEVDIDAAASAEREAIDDAYLAFLDRSESIRLAHAELERRSARATMHRERGGLSSKELEEVLLVRNELEERVDAALVAFAEEVITRLPEAYRSRQADLLTMLRFREQYLQWGTEMVPLAALVRYPLPRADRIAIRERFVAAAASSLGLELERRRAALQRAIGWTRFAEANRTPAADAPPAEREAYQARSRAALEPLRRASLEVLAAMWETELQAVESMLPRLSERGRFVVEIALDGSCNCRRSPGGAIDSLRSDFARSRTGADAKDAAVAAIRDWLASDRERARAERRARIDAQRSEWLGEGKESDLHAEAERLADEREAAASALVRRVGELLAAEPDGPEDEARVPATMENWRWPADRSLGRVIGERGPGVHRWFPLPIGPEARALLVERLALDAAAAAALDANLEAWAEAVEEAERRVRTALGDAGSAVGPISAADAARGAAAIEEASPTVAAAFERLASDVRKLAADERAQATAETWLVAVRLGDPAERIRSQPRSPFSVDSRIPDRYGNWPLAVLRASLPAERWAACAEAVVAASAALLAAQRTYEIAERAACLRAAIASDFPSGDAGRLAAIVERNEAIADAARGLDTAAAARGATSAGLAAALRAAAGEEADEAIVRAERTQNYPGLGDGQAVIERWLAGRAPPPVGQPSRLVFDTLLARARGDAGRVEAELAELGWRPGDVYPYRTYAASVDEAILRRDWLRFRRDQTITLWLSRLERWAR